MYIQKINSDLSLDELLDEEKQKCFTHACILDEFSQETESFQILIRIYKDF